jgi:hypothetical protein
VPSKLASVGAVSATVLVFGCGPGLEAMHESTLRFEHCYRLDMDVSIASPHREHCWRDWTETYASGQPYDRIEYARRRISQLESGDTRLLTFSNSSRPETRVFEELPPANPAAPMAAPAPTSAHEPPPKTAPGPKEPSAADSANSSSLRPGDACSALCSTGLDSCSHGCQNRQVDCAACAEDYRSCMRRCFE